MRKCPSCGSRISDKFMHSGFRFTLDDIYCHHCNTNFKLQLLPAFFWGTIFVLSFIPVTVCILEFITHELIALSCVVLYGVVGFFMLFKFLPLKSKRT